NQMWATIVNRDGVVCAVAFSGVNRGAQWPGSRVISAQKANTANAFSLDSSSSSNGSGRPAGLALSTANLYSAVQPGGSLYGLQHMAATGSLPGVGGVSGDPARPDNIIFDITPNPNGGTGISAGGFGHPTCLNTSGSSTLPAVQP